MHKSRPMTAMCPRTDVSLVFTKVALDSGSQTTRMKKQNVSSSPAINEGLTGLQQPYRNQTRFCEPKQQQQQHFSESPPIFYIS
ncbi:hypothetical protein MKW98_032222 [Papaver atlanticum]|uniref:Uncharacterized protein n=1 Tax=Papaver atlanticum TaxID=357466 RepID=A0AAD4SEH5_9MAGN|nr:hypothetical protein MKW98_032222 [Papaver atlanticum]